MNDQYTKSLSELYIFFSLALQLTNVKNIDSQSESTQVWAFKVAATKRQHVIL